jgi:hypothetical protein
MFVEIMTMIVTAMPTRVMLVMIMMVGTVTAMVTIMSVIQRTLVSLLERYWQKCFNRVTFFCRAGG